MFYTPKTRNGVDETQLPSRPQSVTYTCFTPRKLEMEWMKLNFPQVQSVIEKCF